MKWTLKRGCLMVVEGVVERVRRGSFNHPECLTLEGQSEVQMLGKYPPEHFALLKGSSVLML